MTASYRGRYGLGLVAALMTIGLGDAARAASSEPSEPATVAATPGSPASAFATLEAAWGGVSVIRLGQSQEPTASMPLQRDDVVITKRGRATVRFQPDGTVVRIGPESRVQINETATQRDVTVFFGRLWAHVVRWKERPTRFLSSGTIAAIRGTELSFTVESDGNQTQLAVIEGKVQAQNDAGTLTLNAGQVAVASKGKAPSLSVQVRPRDAVRWALYYLPVLDIKPEAGTGGPAWQAKVRESAEAYRKGDLTRAIDSVASVQAGEVREPRFFTHRATLMLAAGSVDEANQDLDRALKLNANDSGALALQTIIAVVNNDTDKALDSGQRAVAADPRSAAAQIALSYARQAKFDLDGARESLETAVKLAPNDALAWARLAEIRSSFGELGGALDAAKKATSLEPNLARTQTVLGYAYLMQVKIGAAKEAFNKAVSLDPADPLPRLGLALARIRGGDLTGGSEEMEIAVSLDPGQALVRSYLGKAYFEAKRGSLVNRELDVAKQSDPKDPTPWLYEAIEKQTTNRPVEALQSLQEAIELNDNRAVYRSRLLLDADLAARSASLGRLYADMGFQDLALVEGWKSVNTDPSNYSAHRLLADSYAILPRHEIARVSELFQSQMLQPLNTTPIQPSLGESSLFLISSQGPGTLAFNEFNPLFNRNQVNFQGSLVASEDSTWLGEGIASGIYDKVSFSAGYTGFKTDGFRVNADQDDHIANGFVQVQIDPSTSIQAEVRHRKVDFGDLDLRFFENDFSALEQQTNKSTNERIGLRHDFTPGLTVLASYMHQKKDIDFSLPTPEQGYDVTLGRTEKANTVEGQFLFRSGRFRLVGGGGRFDIDANEQFVINDDPFSGFTDAKTTDSTIKHSDLYAYSYAALPRDVTLTLGLSGDFFDETGTAAEAVSFPDFPGEPAPAPADVLGEKNQVNPKLGITWSVNANTTLRAAAFRTLKRTLVTDQTLEPTQVAGFNQFFDDPSTTRSWVYGGAIDQKFSRRLFGGVEFTKRDLTIPQTLIDIENNVTTIRQRVGDERVARAYLFGAPHEQLTLGAEYEYENLDVRLEVPAPDELPSAIGFGFSKVKTHRLPLSARYFHPSGFGAVASATFLKQDGDFLLVDVLQGRDEFVPGNRSFWVVDAGLRYRLPNRYGFVTFGVNNLTDEKSTYQATDTKNLRIRPGRVVYARLVLSFP
jgi:Tfp pilus assembly protein PilF